MASELMLLLKVQNQIMAHYESLLPAERTSVRAASCLGAKQQFGVPDQNNQLECTGVFSQSHETSPSKQGNV